jgi:hypothetical protein
MPTLSRKLLALSKDKTIQVKKVQRDTDVELDIIEEYNCNIDENYYYDDEDDYYYY